MEIIKNYPTICLVHTPCVELDDYKLEPPLGLLYIATVVQNSGYYVKLIDLSVVQITEFTKAIPDQFDVYGFSTYSASYALTQQLAKAVKRRNPQALLIAGGPHATALASQVEKDFDVVVLGEGEIATLQILSWLQQGSKIPKVLKGSPPELDNLPFPNFDLVDLKNYTRIVDGKKSISMLTSRGCPYKCAFCNSNIVGVNKKIRYRSPANIILELQQLKNRYNISALRIQDDLFNFDIKRMRLLAPLLAAEKINYRCFARVNTMSLEMATLLKVGGCVHVSFGVESGSPEILKKMHKGQTIAQIRWGLENAHRVGLKIRIYLIVGFPGETDTTIQETLAFIKTCPWDEFAVYPSIPYPGTPLHDRPSEFGITYINKNYSEYLQIGKALKAGFVFRTKDFDESTLVGWRELVMTELLNHRRTWAGKSMAFK